MFKTDFQSVLVDFQQKAKQFQDEIGKISQAWFTTIANCQKQLFDIAKSSCQGYLPGNMNLGSFGTNDSLKKVADQMQQQFKSMFSNFPLFK